MTNQKYFWGVDCGSSEIKVVLCDPQGNILGKNKTRTLFPLLEHAHKAIIGDGSLPNPFEADGKTVKADHRITATGYGRTHIDFVQEKLTEIKAHCLGVSKQIATEKTYTLIDIGGQDTKVTSVKDGAVQQFVINRKCAAGTGSYIEELAHRLELKMEDLVALDSKHDRELVLNSYCTVFAGQEVIRVLMNGEKVENLIHSLYQSVVSRVLEMTAITNSVIIFSGGVIQYHSPIINIFRKKFPDKKLLIAPDAQFCGALGAAIHGHLTSSGIA